jgi:tetratricopeptide (TPR) repeat protein
VRNAAYFGVFGVRDEHSAAAMPAPNFSGLWQTWEMADGGYMIQALTYEHQPIGERYAIAAKDFHQLLIPASLPEDLALQLIPNLELSGQRADSPDLLFYWYDQAVLEEGEAGPLAGESEERAGRSRLPSREESGLARDEKRLTPVWHPDDLLDGEGEEEQGQRYSLADFTAAPPKRRRRAHEPMHPLGRAGHRMPRAPASASAAEAGHAGQGAAQAPASGGAAAARQGKQAGAERHDAVRREALREAEALAREQSLRRSFDRLYARLDIGDQPALERQVAELLEKNYHFGWKQKFLFSDFGVSLRRKRKYALALLAHRQALKLAPDDENIMFNVARAEYEMGDTGGARDSLAKALRKAPNFAPARTFLQFLEGSA